MEKKTKDSKGTEFKLLFHEGYKGRETPRALIFGQRELKIDRILSRSRRCDRNTGKISDVYTCELEGQTVRITVREKDDFEIAFLPF